MKIFASVVRQTFWKVTLPRLRPILLILVVLRFGSAMAVILILMILGSVAVFGVLGLVLRALVRRSRRVDLPVDVT